jgi:hypothetical protein
MKGRMNRRSFLGAAAGGAGGLLILPYARMARAYEANERLRLAVFGTMYNAGHFLTASHIYNAEVAAVCNVDQRKMAGVFKQWEETAQRVAGEANWARYAEHYRRLARGEGVKVYADVRRMFGEMGDEIDALVVSEVDHLHGVACGAAMRAGKPVCSERPLGLTVGDARGLRALAAETKVATTYRSPGTGHGALRRAMELVGDGAIGAVKEVHVWFKRGGPDREAAPGGGQGVPEGLEWDLWLGPLAWREYHEDWMLYSHWRETSNGGLGVFGPHTCIFPFLALKLGELWDSDGAVVKVRAECSRVNRVSFPRWERVRWEIPARGGMPPVAMTWHHGPEYGPGTREVVHERLRGAGAATALEADALMADAGTLLIGSDGVMAGDDHSVRVSVLPKVKFAGIDTGRPRRMAESRGIYGDWMDACRGGSREILANFENGGRLSELLMVGNIATQFPGEVLTYYPATGKIAGPAEASSRLSYEYRDGWRI